MSVYARPCGSIACKKKHWYYRFRIRGVRYRGAIPEARTSYQAEQAEIRIKNEIFDKKYGVVEKKVPTLSEYIDKVFIPWALKHKRAHRDYKWRCEVLKEAFGSRRMDEITKQMVESFQTGRMEGKTFRGNIRAPKSVNMDVWMLSRIYNHANDNDLDLTNPCAKVEMLDVDNARTRYLSEDEEERLLAQCTGRRAHLRLPILIALHTGMRKQEILKLEWENIDFSRDLIYVRKTKTGRATAIFP